MKPASKRLNLTACLFLCAGTASASADLFKPVPTGDPTYGQLQTLENDGLLPEGASSKSLTRYEVADLIIQAKQKYDSIVVADAAVAPVATATSAIPALPGLPDLTIPPAASAATPVSTNAATSAVSLASATVTPSAATTPSVTAAMPSTSSDDENYTAPPPPSESVMNSGDNAAAATPPPVAPTAKPTPNYAQHPELLKSAEDAFQSLDEAYEVELQAVMQSKGLMLDDLNKAESDQYQLWRDVKAVTESPGISINGIGRMFGVSENIYGNFHLVSQLPVTTYVGVNQRIANPPVTMAVTNPETQYMDGYLDLSFNSTISKQLQWTALMRVGTSDLPLEGDSQYNNAFDTINNVNYDTLNFRWISMQFSPDFMTMTLGDFFQSYTPLTIWNRNNLDFFYKPEPIARADDEYKYESFFNHEPDWPFRGLRVGTELGWPDSDVLDKAKVSAFVHVIANGFDDWPAGGFLFSSSTGSDNVTNTAGQTNYFTDMIYAGHAQLDLKKWYVGDLSVQFSGDAYLVILDEIENNDPKVDYLYFPQPTGSVGYQAGPVTEYIYNPNDPNTWAHQYRITSFKPEVKIGFGDDWYMGLQYEGSFSEYEDDKNDPSRTISDFAVFADPYVQVEDSKVELNVLNVGPNYYSPLAQTRQDYITPQSSTSVTWGPGMSIFSAPLRGQYFLIDQRTLDGAVEDYVDVPRANAIFGYYDRTQDNVFPYGLATPNRQGIGFTLDLKSMPDHNFQLPGAIYFVSEVEPNYVVNTGGTAYTAVDAEANGVAPLRNFVYVNFGPSFNFGPALGLKTPFELGTNIRYENTSSQVGVLQDFDWLTGLRVGLFPWWEITAAFGIHTADGTDMGIDGTTLARYSYIEDNEDLGSYTAFTVHDYEQDLLFSTTFIMDSHSQLHLDYSLESGTNNGSTVASGIYSGAGLNGTVYDQYVEMTYEVKF